jgi:NADH-quinone oxidoreductase subunit A
MSQSRYITGATAAERGYLSSHDQAAANKLDSPVLKSYLPILVFAFLGLTVGGVFALVNHLVGPKKPAKATAASRRQGEPYESGIPVEPTKGLRFGVSFYLVAMLFILFDIEVVFLYPIGVILKGADSLLVLGELVTFVVLLLVAFVYVWRKGALDWR